jgi:AraC-like DNA-binding protein
MQLNADWAGETVAWLQERKIDLRPLFSTLGIDRRDLKFGRQVDARHFAAVLEFGAEATGDDHFGLHRGAAFHIKNGGVLAYLAVSSETVGDALASFERYALVVCDGISAEMKPEHDGVRFVVQISDPVWRRCRHLSEFCIARMIGGLRTITGVALAPLEVRFMHPYADASAECRRLFRCATTYNAPADTIRFAKETLAIRIPSANSRLGQMLHAYADGLLHQARAKPAASLEEQVLAIVADRLAAGRLSSEDVARDLGMSERTLRRRLADDGTSFSALVDRVRRSLAKDWLAGGDFDLKHISFLLGYSEPAAFSRAYKRWTGSSPGRARAKPGRLSPRGGRTPARPAGRAGA